MGDEFVGRLLWRHLQVAAELQGRGVGGVDAGLHGIVPHAVVFFEFLVMQAEYIAGTQAAPVDRWPWAKALKNIALDPSSAVV